MFEARRTAPSVLLVRGCPRSGTTFVTLLLNASPHIGLIAEYPLDALVRDLGPILMWERAHEGELAAASVVSTANGRERALSIAPQFAQGDDSYINTQRPIPRSFPTAATFPEIVASVVQASLRKSDLQIIGSKTPGVRLEGDGATLGALFPRVRYLFVVRNPFDTINSSINLRNRARTEVSRWHVGDVEAAIDEYRASIRYLYAHVARYGDDCFVVKYEDLEERFHDTVERLSAFLDVPLDDVLATRVELHTWRKTVLTADESDAVFAAFPDAIETWRDKPLTGPGTRVAPLLGDCVDVAVPGKLVRYCGSPERHFLGLGWNDVDAHGVWSAAHDADLIFTVAKSGRYAISLELSAFANAAGTPVHLTVRLDGEPIFRALAVPTSADAPDVRGHDLSILTGSVPRTFSHGPFEFGARTTHRLSFEVDRLGSPAESGMSSDARRLGICLHSFLLTEG